MGVHEGRTLLLGGTGFLGAQLALAWARRRAGRCIVAARRPERLPAFEGRERMEFRVWDATERGATERLFRELRPTGVILAAALARAGDCEREPDLARELNVALPDRVARLARSHQARLVHISTDLVFGARPPREERFREEDPTQPVHSYGRSKADGEAAVLVADPGALVVRLPLLLGDSFGRALGASDSLIAALERGERPRLFSDEWRTPLDVEEAARAVWEAFDLGISGILHIAGPERCTRLELGKLVLAVLGRRDRLEACTRAEAGVAKSRARDASLDTRRARSILTTTLPAPGDSLRRPSTGDSFA